MRLATYNTEWFNTLFHDDGTLDSREVWSARWNITRRRQIGALGAVFTALDADMVMVIEAPDDSPRRSTVRALQTFAAAFGLRARKALIGFANHTQQEIALLYDPDVVSARHAPEGDDTAANPRFDRAWAYDTDLDTAPDMIAWSKPPLEVAVTPRDGAPFRLIGVHAKSKAAHGATSHAQAMRIAIQNRRKQLAQCIWLRRRVDDVLARSEPLIVLGDFNDGPGLDDYEQLFGRSGVELVLGEPGPGQLHDPHARQALGQRLAAMPTTARFHVQGGPYLQALLDYIMVSPDIAARSPRWQIWHPFDNPACYDNVDLREALLDASDHFPVTIDWQP